MNDVRANINQYIEAVRHKPFQWGRHDCLSFANDCSKIVAGKPFADDWLGQYDDAISALRWYKRLLKKYGFSDIIEATDARLKRSDLRFPPIGSLAGKTDKAHTVTEVAFGVCIGTRVAFLSDEGLIFLPISQNDIFWSFG